MKEERLHLAKASEKGGREQKLSLAQRRGATILTERKRICRLDLTKDKTHHLNQH